MNAILLAAGYGSRFGEITKHTHKALLPIDGVPNIERTIDFLRCAGVTNIIIVTGYLDYQFKYLENLYGCTIVHNEKYNIYNNMYSMFKAFEYFGECGGSYIIDADVVFFSNIFKEETYSKYFLIQRPKSSAKEWNPIVNKNGQVIDIIVSSEYMPSLLGVSYWTDKDANKIKTAYDHLVNEKILLNPGLYWDDIPKSILNKLLPRSELLKQHDAIEMDTNEDYERVKGFF